MKNYKPSTPSRRHMTVVPYRELTTKSKPYKRLLIRLRANAGRNNRGVITVRHKGGGNKKLYRLVDFKQEKLNVPARVETVEYDPYRSAFISKIVYKDGERRYILSPKDVSKGDEIIVSESAPIKPGNRMKIKNIPVGSLVHNVALKSGGSAKLARSAGAYAEVLSHEGKYAILKLSSKEVRKILSDNFASIGQVSNQDYSLIKIGKAGRSRWKGVRPTVRGTAMNPVDHPYGGGEGRQPRGTRRPKTMWGKITGGVKTRKRKKWSNKFIIQRRPKIR